MSRPIEIKLADILGQGVPSCVSSSTGYTATHLETEAPKSQSAEMRNGHTNHLDIIYTFSDTTYIHEMSTNNQNSHRQWEEKIECTWIRDTGRSPLNHRNDSPIDYRSGSPMDYRSGSPVDYRSGSPVDYRREWDETEYISSDIEDDRMIDHMTLFDLNHDMTNDNEATNKKLRQGTLLPEYFSDDSSFEASGDETNNAIYHCLGEEIGDYKNNEQVRAHVEKVPLCYVADGPLSKTREGIESYLSLQRQRMAVVDALSTAHKGLGNRTSNNDKRPFEKDNYKPTKPNDTGYDRQSLHKANDKQSSEPTLNKVDRTGSGPTQGPVPFHKADRTGSGPTQGPVPQYTADRTGGGPTQGPVPLYTADRTGDGPAQGPVPQYTADRTGSGPTQGPVPFHKADMTGSGPAQGPVPLYTADISSGQMQGPVPLYTTDRTGSGPTQGPVPLYTADISSGQMQGPVPRYTADLTMDENTDWDGETLTLCRRRRVNDSDVKLYDCMLENLCFYDDPKLEQNTSLTAIRNEAMAAYKRDVEARHGKVELDQRDPCFTPQNRRRRNGPFPC